MANNWELSGLVLTSSRNKSVDISSLVPACWLSATYSFRRRRFHFGGAGGHPPRL